MIAILGLLIILGIAGVNSYQDGNVKSDKSLSSRYNSSPIKVVPYQTQEDELHFVALGDWGTGKKDQRKVAKAMGKKCKSSNCQFVMSVGDNFYPNGVTSVKDEQFETKWRNVYNKPGISNLKW